MLKIEMKNLLDDYWFDNKYLQQLKNELKIEESITEGVESNEAKIYEKEVVHKIFKKKNYIEHIIQRLSQPYKTIMFMKYISFMSFDQIADKMHYSTKRIYQLHSEGLAQMTSLSEKEEQGLAQISTD